MPLTPGTIAISFWRRGLPALLFILGGVASSFIFRKSSAWPLDVKHLMFPTALLLAIGGSVLLSSYVRQRPLRTMKTELVSAGLLLATMLLLG